MYSFSEVVTFDKIFKSVNDKRRYDTVTLDNGLKVIVVNDPDTIMSACALSVNVGSLHNKYVPLSDKGDKFTEVHGIAHFLEHMLFLGSEKYPDETIYSKLIGIFGGFCNAYTDMNSTCYYFSSSSVHFDQILDIFGNFFIKPLLTKSAIMREMKSVQEEHNKNYHNDNWRELQISRNISKHDNMWNGFATGTINSLNVANIDILLANFFNAYYVPTNMNLVLISNKPTKDLIAIAKNIFSLIPKRQLVQSPFKQNDYLPYDAPKIVLTSPIHTKNSLVITWQIPNYDIYFIKYRYINPLNFIAHVIKYRSENSIYDYLKRNNYATSLEVEPLQYINNVFLFSIQISLTPEGLIHKAFVVDVIYSYINLFRNICLSDLNGKIKDIYEEIQLIKQQEILYQNDNYTKEDSLEFVKSLAETLTTYKMKLPTEEVLIAGSLLSNYEPNINLIIFDILSYFKETNSVTYFISKNYEGILTKRDPWYGVEYELVRHNSLRKSATYKFELDTMKHLSLPNKNKYISKTIGRTTTDLVPYKHPVYVDSFKHYKLWYQYTANRFNNPYVSFTVHINLPKLTISILTWLAFKIYIDCIVDTMSTDLYQAMNALYEPELSLSQYDMTISIVGPYEKFGTLLNMFVKNMLRPERVDQNLFLKIRRKIYQDLTNNIFIAPYENTIQKLFLDTGALLYSTKDLLQQIMNVTYDTVLNAPDTVFSEVFIESIIIGNILLEDATNLALMFKPLSEKSMKSAKPKTSLRRINVGEKKVIRSLPDNSKEFNVASGLFYSIGNIRPITTYSKNFDLYSWNYITCACNLIDSIINHEYIDQLRTNEQLGYIVAADFILLGPDSDPLLTYGFVVQSSVKKSEYLVERTETFVRKMKEIISSEKEEDLLARKTSLINLLLRQPSNLNDLTIKSVNKAFNTDNVMNLEDILMNTYNNITVTNLVEFYDRYFYNEVTRSVWIVEINQ